MLTVLLVCNVFILARGTIIDTDIWWHNRNAEYLLQTHHFPNHDAYSFTVAGNEWMNYEWLAEMPFYAAWKVGGTVGTEVLMIALVEVIFLELLYLCYRVSGNIKASLLSCAFCSYLAVVSFGPRTILFGYAYLVLLLIILERFRSGQTRSIWILPPLFCLWSNTHGSWLLGLIVFGIVVAAGFVEGQWGRVESKRWSVGAMVRLSSAWLASAAALFVNPFGWRMVLYPFEFASKQKLNVSHVMEWASVDFHEVRGKVVLGLLIGLILLALFRNRKWMLAEVGLLLFGLYSGLTYVRFLFFLAMLIAPLIAKLLDVIPPYQPEIDKPVLNAIFMVGAIVVIATYFPVHSAVAHDAAAAAEFPAGALPYLKEHPLNGNLLNYYNWGGYLGWHDRNLKVFIDSRVDIFEYAGVLKDYLDAAELREPDKIFDKYKIRYALLPPSHHLTYVLERDPRWKVHYRDSVSVLLERSPS